MEKEVKTQLEKKLKNDLKFTIINLLEQGKNPQKISKELNISLPNLSYYLRQFKDCGLLVKKGYGVWEVKKEVKTQLRIPSHKETRGHGFTWVVKVPKENKSWSNRLEILIKKSISFKLVGIKQTPRIMIRDRKVWLGNKQIVIYEPFSYFGTNAIESRKLAVYELLKIIRTLEEKLGIDLKTKEGYLFHPSKEHYALIRNSLAIQCDKEGKKLSIVDKGKEWCLCDNSFNLHELETVNDNSLVNNLGLQKVLNSYKNTGWKVTPEFTLNAINQVTQNQSMYNKNFESHVSAIKELSSSVRRLTEQVERLEELNRKLRLK